MLKVVKTILFSLLFSALVFAAGIKSSLEVGGNLYIKGNLYLKSDETAPETTIVQITKGSNKPAIRWTPQGWQYTNDGTTWNNFGSGGGGGGDMYKVVYDINNNGIVDNSESVVDNAITPSKIQDGAITTAKLSDYSVNETKLASNSVSTDKIKNGAVTTDKLADNSVNSAKIANETITNEDISPTANISLTKLSSYPFGTNDIQDGAITASKIQDSAVTGTKIQNGVITENHLSPAAKILKTNEVLILPSISGNNGKFLKTDGSTLIWDTPSGGSGIPGGNNKAIQYNNNSSFAGDDNLTWDSGLQQLLISSSGSAIKIQAIPTTLDFKNRTGTDEAINYFSEGFKFVPNTNASSFSIVVRLKNTDTDYDANVSLKLYSDSYGLPDQQLATSNSNTVPKNSGYAEYSFTFNYSVSNGTTYWIVVDNPYLPPGNLYWDRDNSGSYEYVYFDGMSWYSEDSKGVWYKFGVYQTKAFDIDEKATIELNSSNPIFVNNLKIKQYPYNRVWLYSNNGTLAFGLLRDLICIGHINDIQEDGTINPNSAHWVIANESGGGNRNLVFKVNGNEKIRIGDGFGAALKINGITYSFPSSQGASNSVLINNGSGYLTWTIPVGGSDKSAISTISVGSSPFVYQQTAYNLASVIVSGGVVTSIEISRNNADWYNVGLTSGQFTLNKNDYIRITYTTAPNMYLMEH